MGGIGGLEQQFDGIFRRAFANRNLSPKLLTALGIKHVRGILLYGPPGTGKTLIARKLAHCLKCADPKIISGPEILNQYVGKSEENVRDLFKEAEEDHKFQKENSLLHIIIFDEIDSICKSRGSNNDGTGVGDRIVNQLLSKMDGVDQLNNIFIIGMTNRIDMIDEALLRPGRLELHVEISLPDDSGRLEILQIHTKDMKSNGLLDDGVSLQDIANTTQNYSGAELEGLVRSATSFASHRYEEHGNYKVLKEDFEHALTEVKPAFGRHDDDLEQLIGRGIIQYSDKFRTFLSLCERSIDHVRNSKDTLLHTVLLSGRSGSGKTALVAHMARQSAFPFVRCITNDNYVGYSEYDKVQAMRKVFSDAYKSSLSLIMLDDLERLMDYVRIGPSFSNLVLQTLFTLLRRQPPKTGSRLLVIATTSVQAFIEETQLIETFRYVHQIPVLKTLSDYHEVLQTLPDLDEKSANTLSLVLTGRTLPIKTLLLVASMVAQEEGPVSTSRFLLYLSQISSGAANFGQTAQPLVPRFPVRFRCFM